MKLSVRRLGSSQPADKAPRSRVVKPKLLAILVVAVLIAGGYFIFHKHSQPGGPSSLASASTVEKNDQTVVAGYLKNNDLEKYQLTQVNQATLYWENKDYNNAERIMLDVFQRVPASTIDTSSYAIMVTIEKSKGDKTQEKKYLQLIIPKLKAQGDTQAVAYYNGLLHNL
jgi:uncharacterized protein (UPF0333 family)